MTEEMGRSESGDAVEKPENRESGSASLEDATITPEAYVEQSQDFQQAEAVEANLTQLIDATLASPETTGSLEEPLPEQAVLEPGSSAAGTQNAISGEINGPGMGDFGSEDVPGMDGLPGMGSPGVDNLPGEDIPGTDQLGMDGLPGIENLTGEDPVGSFIPDMGSNPIEDTPDTPEGFTNPHAEMMDGEGEPEPVPYPGGGSDEDGGSKKESGGKDTITGDSNSKQSSGDEPGTSKKTPGSDDSDRGRGVHSEAGPDASGGGSVSHGMVEAEVMAAGLDPNITGETITDPAGPEDSQHADSSGGIDPKSAVHYEAMPADEGGGGGVDLSGGMKAGPEVITDPVPESDQQKDTGVQKDM